ncbi:hypothetical protein P7K49_018493 [Saguinus oedipus]|uniref:Uncharacterized protein n=1 Tax=Saguinus oedipus TaxID=9490 RepID=A0ABQ9V606_SAGOE|nr:hypothetical protein P7K49_018493 [Saguinus oedipus]
MVCSAGTALKPSAMTLSHSPAGKTPGPQRHTALYNESDFVLTLVSEATREIAHSIDCLMSQGPHVRVLNKNASDKSPPDRSSDASNKKPTQQIHTCQQQKPTQASLC